MIPNDSNAVGLWQPVINDFPEIDAYPCLQHAARNYLDRLHVQQRRARIVRCWMAYGVLTFFAVSATSLITWSLLSTTTGKAGGL